MIICCGPQDFYLAEWCCNILKLPYKCKVGKYRSCNLQFNHNPNKNPTVQHICKEQNSNYIKWVLFRNDCKHQLLFVCGRPLSIIALFYRPPGLPKSLFFSVFFFPDGCQESFHGPAVPLCNCDIFLSYVQVATCWNKIIMCIFTHFGDAVREEL